MRRRAGLAGWALVCIAATVGAHGPQDPAPAQFSSGVQLIEVYATVTDAAGTPMTGLRAEDFEIFEDGRRQQVDVFAFGDVPLTVVLGVDRSWSMAGERLTLAKRASQRFLEELRPTDRSMVIAISSEPEVVAPLTMSRADQARAIGLLDPWSTTALHDAIIDALDRLEGTSGRQALVVFSDGADRYSRADAAAVVARARRSQALIYPIGLGRERPALLAELAVVTGGRSFQVRDVRELEGTLATVARELRSQYLIGYTPTPRERSANGEWRSIRVEVRRPGVRVRARDGYVAD
jgi:Ca-activated chloride channel family protein